MAAPGFRPDLEPRVPEGAGPEADLVVLLHGTFCDGRTTLAYARALAGRGLRVWIYEYPYLRDLPGNAARFDEAMARRLADDGVDPGRLAGVGYSQGGMILRYLLSGHGQGAWCARMRTLVQVASPNAGVTPGWLVALLTPEVDGSCRFPALEQMRVGSALLEDLARRPLAPELSLGIVYGEGRGQDLLERFFFGRLRDHWTTRLLDLVWSGYLLDQEAHDGLVSVASVLSVLTLPGAEAYPAPLRVETDHLGLLGHPEAVQGVADLVTRLMGRSAAERA